MAQQSDSLQTACARCRDPGALDFAFVFAYQPIVDCARRTIFGHEALVRGPNGESAATILAKVNDDNRYLFDQACRVKAIEGAAALGMKEMLSINFLPNAVYKPEACIQATLRAARQSGFPIERIIFEVTEGEQVRDRPHLVDIFNEYRRFGFSTAIDDFGAGYAGLTLLAEFQPTIVKLDMELVRDIDTKPAKQAIVGAVLAMCAELQVTVLAEGVETAAERDFLYTRGINLMQGYFFARPAFRSLGAVATGAWPASR
jgi:EAL domain-containing protein (putative c-di-GMP-specific phosphodiesterase class I)